MLVVESIAKLCRDHLVGGNSSRPIARERGVSRNAVRSDETEFATSLNNRAICGFVRFELQLMSTF